jgi:molecular chaperone GrpE
VTPEERDTATKEAAAEQAAAPEAVPAEGAAPGEEPASADRSASADPSAPASADAAAPLDAPAPAPDYKDQWLRAAAELENVRKRARRDVAAAESRGIAKLAKELLPALDNFERALAAAEEQPENRDHHLTDGIRLVQTELLASLARVGIEPDSPKGQRFDPHRHEAVAQQPIDGAEPGTIVEVYSAGYTYGDDVLRPAKVVVAG